MQIPNNHITATVWCLLCRQYNYTVPWTAHPPPPRSLSSLLSDPAQVYPLHCLHPRWSPWKLAAWELHQASLPVWRKTENALDFNFKCFNWDQTTALCLWHLSIFSTIDFLYLQQPISKNINSVTQLCYNLNSIHFKPFSDDTNTSLCHYSYLQQ